MLDWLPEFLWPWLALLLPAPWIISALLPSANTVGGGALKLPQTLDLPIPQAEQAPPHRPWWRWIAVVAWWCLVFAAMRPIAWGEPIELPTSGREMLLAVDISGSMGQQDMRLNGRSVTRLQSVQAVAGDFIQRRSGDRIGLILFGARAYLQAPITRDRKTVVTLLQEAEEGLAGKETAIGDGIGLAVKRLQNRPSEEKVLILLTDGANTAGNIDPMKAAELAATANVTIHSIAFGGEQQVRFGPFVQTVGADVDEQTLQAIAQKTGGEFFRARNSAELAKIYRQIDRLEPIDAEAEVLRPQNELFWMPLSAALMLSLTLPFWARLSHRTSEIMRARGGRFARQASQESGFPRSS